MGQGVWVGQRCAGVEWRIRVVAKAGCGCERKGRKAGQRWAGAIGGEGGRTVVIYDGVGDGGVLRWLA